MSLSTLLCRYFMREKQQPTARQQELHRQSELRHELIQEMQSRYMQLEDTRRKVDLLEKKLTLKLRRHGNDGTPGNLYS